MKKIIYDTFKRNRVRLTKIERPTLSIDALWIQININPMQNAKETIKKVEEGHLDPDTIDTNLSSSAIELSPKAKEALKTRPSSSLPLKRLCRHIESQTIRIGGLKFARSNVSSQGRMICSVGENGNIEFARAWACQFFIDPRIVSTAKQFQLNKVCLDIDGPSSTAICSFRLRLQVRIYRVRGDNVPSKLDDLLAQETVVVLGSGIATCSFDGMDAISHRYKAKYWLVVQPQFVSLTGDDVLGAQWYWRYASLSSDAKNPVIAHSTLLNPENVDPTDLLESSSTKFIPNRKGVDIVGVDSWNMWTQYRCVQCEEKMYDIQHDPTRYGTNITCQHQPAFAYSVSVKHPYAMEYSIERSKRFRRLEISQKKNVLEGLNSEVSRQSHVRKENIMNSHPNPLQNTNKQIMEEGVAEMSLFPQHDFGKLLADIEVHIEYKHTQKSLCKRFIQCSKTLRNILNGCKISLCSGTIIQSILAPFKLAHTLMKTFFIFLVYLFWVSVICVIYMVWVVVSIFQCCYGIVVILISERHVIYLNIHMKMCKCTRISWRVSAGAIFMSLLIVVIHIFIVDVLLGWGVEYNIIPNSTDLNNFLIGEPSSRFLYMAPVFLSCIVLYAIRGAPELLYNLESMDPVEGQNIRYEATKSDGDIGLFAGVVVQRFGDALGVLRNSSDKKVEVIHVRNVVQIGLYENDATSSTNAEVIKNSIQNSSESKLSFTNEIDQLHLKTSSGKLSLDLQSAKWRQWIQRSQGLNGSKNLGYHSVSKNLRWYDQAFGPFLLRYVLTTHRLPNFSAHRTALMLVNETDKLYTNHGEIKNERRDSKNSYINAFMILFISLHLSLTKRVFQVFLCSEQPNGSFTLIENPETICVDSNGKVPRDYASMRAMGWFFMILYAVGIPCVIAYTLKGIFRQKRECQPKVRDRYGYLYFKYTNLNYLWEPLVILPRKSILALIRMVTRNGGVGMHRLQAASCLLIMSGFALFHISRRPFIEDGLNNMEAAALLNHIFVLFIGLCFLSDAISVPEDSPANNEERENIFASVMIGSMVVTILYLLYGILLELWEGGIITMGSKGIVNIVNTNFENTRALLRRTIRSHWALRSMHNFVRKVDVVHEDKSDSDTISAHRRKGHVYHAPPPPRHTPPTVIAYDWGCKYCGHENDLTNNPYAVNCAQCYQPRVHDTFNINRSLVEKKKSLMMDKEIKESILLSSDAEYAAIQWGISDRSTTLRETKWLIEALDSLSKNILEVYFDTKQMTIQEEEQKAYEERLSYVLQIFQPILSIMKCFSSMIKKDENTLAEKVCQNWSVERDEISRKQYYTYTGGNGRERFRYIGWYEFFDAGSGRLYYSLLG